jgi:vacuolar protein sorting-associated protein VTA1
MASDKVPLVLKPINPYILRGRELTKANGDKLVAFHCFKHAMDMGIKLNDKSPECQGFLMELIGELEAMKPSIAGKSQEELKSACENFAQAVFQRADGIDKAGNADKATAQSFYAAASFLEILKQFSPEKELDPDIKQLAVYAKWRAAEIVKAIREGRKPTPPGNGEGVEEHGHSEEDAPSLPPAAPTHSPASASIPVARPPAPGVTVTSSPSAPARPTASFMRQASSLNKAKKADCLENIRFARAALEADDIGATVERLNAVLALLHES